MVQGSTFAGWRAQYDLSLKEHWFVDAAESLDNESVGTVWIRDKGNLCVAIVFSNTDKERVARVLKRLPNIRLTGPPEASAPSGAMACVEVKAGKDRFVSALSRFPGRVTLHVDPKRAPNARIIVESPLAFGLRSEKDLESFGKTIDSLPHIELFSEPRIERVMLQADEFVDLNDTGVGSDLLDEKDVRIALELFNAGYYDPKVKEKETLEKIAKRADTTKPTLIKRKKRLEALGISAILGPKMSQQDMRKASDTLRMTIKRKTPQKQEVNQESSARSSADTPQ